MNWISLAIQFLSARRAMLESHAVIEAAQAMAERAKRYAVSTVGILVALFLYVCALVVGVIEIGLQIEAQAFPHFSGLFVSALIFFVIGSILVLISLLFSLSVARVDPPKKPEPQLGPRAEQVKDLLEEFIVVFLSDFLKNKR